jgi:hypothetical protein
MRLMPSAAPTAQPARLFALSASLLLAASAAAADPDPVLSNDVRLVLGTAPAYEVEESTTGHTYDWKGTDNSAIALGLQGVVAAEPSESSGVRWLWGVEVLGQQATIEPSSYDEAGTTYVNTTGERFEYVALSPLIFAGLRLTEPASSQIGLFAELQAGVGATVLYGELRNQLGSDRSLGYGVDLALRAVVGLQEAGWTGAVQAGVRRRWAGISFDQNTHTSDFTLDAVGPEVMLVVGRKF